MSGVITWEVKVIAFDGRVPTRVGAKIECSVDQVEWVEVHGSHVSAVFDGDPVLLRPSGPVEPGDWVRLVFDSGEEGAVHVVASGPRFTRREEK